MTFKSQPQVWGPQVLATIILCHSCQKTTSPSARPHRRSIQTNTPYWYLLGPASNPLKAWRLHHPFPISIPRLVPSLRCPQTAEITVPFRIRFFYAAIRIQKPKTFAKGSDCETWCSSWLIQLWFTKVRQLTWPPALLSLTSLPPPGVVKWTTNRYDHNAKN